MKVANSILVAHVIAAVVVTIILIISYGGFGSAADAAFAFVCLQMGIVAFFGFVLGFARAKEWQQGFFPGGSVLLLLSGFACSGGAML